MARKFLITAALPYSNGRLHVGHIAGAYLPADIYVRYLRARIPSPGRAASNDPLAVEDVKFICGSDDNGVAALIAARNEGMSVQELTAKYNARQKADFEALDIAFDIYGGTHQPGYAAIHEKLSQEFFRAIHDAGYFVKKATDQLYDPVAGQFLPDRYVVGTCPECGHDRAYGDQCDQCGKSMDPLKLKNPKSTVTPGVTPEVRKTVHWYLQLAKIQAALVAWLTRASTGGWRETLTRFALAQAELGLPERAMTRDLTWGIPVPLDDPDAKGKALYVWFDAPIGYVTFTQALLQGSADSYEDYWKNPDCRIIHFIGEDNIVFHAITWPAMLMAFNTHAASQSPPRPQYNLPSNVVANCFLNYKKAGQPVKFSKRDLAADDPGWVEEYIKKFVTGAESERLGVDPLRFYLTAIAPETARTFFSMEEFFEKNNELGNVLGNFVNRTLTFAAKYFENKVPSRQRSGTGGQGSETRPTDQAMLQARETGVKSVAEHLEACRFKAAQEAAMELARVGNKYFADEAPFKTRKTDMALTGTIINVCLQVCRTLATIFGPFLPGSARRIAAQLGLADVESAMKWDTALDELAAGHTLGKAEILFRKPEAPAGSRG
jgi:methionyl-tRNA synthetase